MVSSESAVDASIVFSSSAKKLAPPYGARLGEFKNPLCGVSRAQVSFEEGWGKHHRTLPDRQRNLRKSSAVMRLWMLKRNLL